MKYAFIAALAVLATAGIATAGSLQTDLNFADTGSRTNSKEVIVRYSDELPLGMVYGVGLEAKQPEKAGDVAATVSGTVGADIKAPLGVTVTPRVELGSRFAEGNNHEFWGVGLTANRQLVGPLSANVSYRYREGFDSKNMDESRTSVGVSYNVNARYTIGANFNRSTGTDRSDSIGVFGRVNF